MDLKYRIQQENKISKGSNGSYSDKDNKYNESYNDEGKYKIFFNDVDYESTSKAKKVL